MGSSTCACAPSSLSSWRVHKRRQIHANPGFGSARIRVGWMDSSRFTTRLRYPRCNKPLHERRSQSRRKLAPRGINILLRGMIGRMFTANFSPQKENGTIASWPLFLFSPVLEQATVGIFNMNMRSMRPAARIACNPCAGAVEHIDERPLVWKRRLWLFFLYSKTTTRLASSGSIPSGAPGGPRGRATSQRPVAPACGDLRSTGTHMMMTFIG